MKIAVRDLKPNPFRRMDKGYPIDRKKVQSLKDSITETSFWDNIIARKVDGHFELAYGHHRWVALKELGIEEINIPIRDLDDRTMLKIMANENMEQWAWNVGVINETIEAVRDFIKKSGAPATFDWQKGIEDFLGKGWSGQVIKSALATIAADAVTEEQEAESEAEVKEAVEEAKETKTKPKKKRVKRAVSRKAVETFTLPSHADVIRTLLTSPLYGGLLAKGDQEKFVKKMYKEMVDGNIEITESHIKEKFCDSILKMFKKQIEARKEEQESLKKALERAKPKFDKAAIQACKEWQKVCVAILKVKTPMKDLDAVGVDKVEVLIGRVESRISAWRHSL